MPHHKLTEGGKKLLLVHFLKEILQLEFYLRAPVAGYFIQARPNRFPVLKNGLSHPEPAAHFFAEIIIDIDIPTIPFIVNNRYGETVQNIVFICIQTAVVPICFKIH